MTQLNRNNVNGENIIWSLQELIEMLRFCFDNKRVVVIIDEYDKPILHLQDTERYNSI